MLRLSPSSFSMCLLALVPPFPSSFPSKAALVTGSYVLMGHAIDVPQIVG